ncbi:hypothetical protein RRG08_032490 [Elysia crispata]|uniref:Uncharacterized protein n=1 Tax=Elysia crispata TaxID=231223 RepID=A0AAE0ZXP9_9GAST|nr:hypothetical protein RRG08_032490 [Elysia crispata]
MNSTSIFYNTIYTVLFSESFLGHVSCVSTTTSVSVKQSGDQESSSRLTRRRDTASSVKCPALLEGRNHIISLIGD